jgi:putative SOS response-associated peptidase YedK
MCNLYRMTRSVDEIAGLFGALAGGSTNAGQEVFPGYPGIVVAEGKVQSMTWGFPLSLKGKSGQKLKHKPVNNTRSDKLDSFKWRYSFKERRCLIPVSAFAEAEGTKGGKTRTWLSVPDEEVFACAGIWRDSEEWGRVYSMVMADACLAMDGIHNRMRFILAPEDYDRWLTDQPEAALELCRPFEGELTIERTDERRIPRSRGQPGPHHTDLREVQSSSPAKAYDVAEHSLALATGEPRSSPVRR